MKKMGALGMNMEKVGLLRLNKLEMSRVRAGWPEASKYTWLLYVLIDVWAQFQVR